MTAIFHILITGETPRPWWPADQRWNIAPDENVWCDCCNAWSPAGEADVRLMIEEFPVGGTGYYQEQWTPHGPDFEQHGFQPSYFDPHWQTRCAEGFGCSVKPRRRASAHLRARG